MNASRRLKTLFRNNDAEIIAVADAVLSSLAPVPSPILSPLPPGEG